MRVLVTGASGFIGRNVVAQLERQGVDVVAASRRPLVSNPAVRFEPIDLLTPGASADLVSRVRPTHLIHLAWNAIPRKFWSASDNLDWAAATFALSRAFVDAGGVRAVMAGSCAEYDWTGIGRLHENSGIAPATLYGKVKDATRRAVCAFGEESGLPVAWGRVFWLYGPGEAADRLVSDVASALARRHQINTTEGRQQRDFLHVEDVASAFIAALHHTHCGPFNIGSGSPVAVRHLIEILAEELGGLDLVNFGVRPSTLGEPSLLVADTKILHETIGFTPRYGLESGLKSTADWWRNHVS
ncbi:GDP-6-deoxy-D-mannose reductase [Methylorubrum aminovorans]|uniref:GDP-6-deoxy-D-mannose reductase n=1 Tax=Methylorubrum aminovorans TaxID=269069 RepID=A0ABQ4UEX2_9HYPH|nr:NAD(P)-dependent oxidoreductase [Methylorubrum aminovorans]GJE65048.1 GDP-6-deoxy-D-mannose reductase [Methylorubrum aminovorans]